MNKWETEAAAIRAKARRTELRVLIWGPGKPPPGANESPYLKRLQMKQVVSANFPFADVAFSEDDLLQAMTAYERNQLRKEAIHAHIADLILMLDISRGVDLELDHFVLTYPWVRDKLFIFMPKEYVESQGLVANVLKKMSLDQIYGFTPDEMATCNIATKMSLEIVDAFAVHRMLSNL